MDTALHSHDIEDVKRFGPVIRGQDTHFHLNVYTVPNVTEISLSSL